MLTYVLIYLAGALTPPLAYGSYLAACELGELWRNVEYYCEDDNITMLTGIGRCALWLMRKIKRV